MDKGRTAILIGATGLVGKALLQQLLSDDGYGEVVVLGRRPTGLSHAKLVEHVIDFAQPEGWADLVKGDVLFSTLGTTRGQAGGTAAQRVVDYDYQYLVARTAAANGVGTYVLVSSIGADASASAFYMRMKGELDRDVSQLPFGSIHILRPGPLSGERAQPRLGERVGLALIGCLNALGLLRRYRPILDVQVARAMRVAALQPGKPAQVHEAEELFAMAAE